MFVQLVSEVKEAALAVPVPAPSALTDHTQPDEGHDTGYDAGSSLGALDGGDWVTEGCGGRKRRDG